LPLAIGIEVGTRRRRVRPRSDEVGDDYCTIRARLIAKEDSAGLVRLGFGDLLGNCLLRLTRKPDGGLGVPSPTRDVNPAIQPSVTSGA